jgi:hypothetical protein
MKCVKTLLVAFFVLGFIGCGQSDLPTGLGDATVEAQQGFENGPWNPGSSPVFRYEDIWVVGSTDPERDLIAWHFFAENWTGCGGAENFPLANTHVVESPSGALIVLGVYENIPVYIYRLSEWDAAVGAGNVCDFLSNNWLFKGVHRMGYNDSDNILGGEGMSSWSWKAHGNVEDPNGVPHRYTEQQHAIWDFETNTPNWLTENIRVHPIGN